MFEFLVCIFSFHLCIQGTTTNDPRIWNDRTSNDLQFTLLTSSVSHHTALTMSESSSSDSEASERVQDSRPGKKPRTEQADTNSRLTTTPLQVADNTNTKTKPKSQPIIILLDQATLETVKNKRGVYELLNCDDHRDLCKKKLHKDPNVYRPDILHQEMLALLDSPLNKAGMVRIYIQSQKNVLIEVNPTIRIPRTYKRFAGLMVQLLHKLKIKAGSESATLLKVIKNPFSQYLPAGTHCYGMTQAGTLYSPFSLAQSLLPATPNEGAAPVCFIVGAMSTGHVTIEDHPYMEKMFSISEYPLSGAAALSRIASGIEHHWSIV
jgi:rRNA small subunit pseudouridine methyltransferase Nep1